MKGQPYRYEQLTHVSRSEVVRLRTLVRALPAAADPRVLHEAGALLGAALGMRPLAPELVAGEALRASLPDPLCALSLVLEAEARPWPLWLELPLPAAAVLVDRTLGGDGRALPALGRALDELSAGVLGYLAARLCAAGDRGLRVRAIESNRDAFLPIGRHSPWLVWPLALTLDGARLAVARVLLPEPSATALARLGAASTARPPPVLAELVVPVCAHAGRVSLRRAELAAVEPGDAIVPDCCRLARDASGRYSGEIELHAVGSRNAFSCRLDGTALTLERASYCGEGTMTETKSMSSSGEGANELAADAPIELCLELARFSLPLRELSALRPGEVLSTGSAVGAVVTLSASGRPVARGELVEIEGEVGMRVLELVR
jgi:type III secretion protein Q